MSDLRRSIPSVDSLIESDVFEPLCSEFGRVRSVVAARAAVDRMRTEIALGAEPASVVDPSWYGRVAAAWLRAEEIPSLRAVINATGVVLHTNLGRAPLAVSAAQAMLRAAEGYGNLEYDLEKGTRGSRYEHCRKVLMELTGAEAALVVNNNAAALMLAMNTLARGRAVVVSRGELVEIGGGFRIPEILERSGVELVEVGSTNRTRLADYEHALDQSDVAVLLKVHRSNFRITGFTEEAGLSELADLAAARGIPLVHDLGSGLFIRAELLGLPDEPRAVDSLAAGANLVAVSGDKLLGGPQAGILLGDAETIRDLRSNPMCRALRVDKVTLAGLEATLRLYRDPERAVREIPTLRMLSADPAEIRGRAEALAAVLVARGLQVDLIESEGAVGGGTYPGVPLPSWCVGLRPSGGAAATAARLRAGAPPVVARIENDRLLFDLRTVMPGHEDELARRIVESGF